MRMKYRCRSLDCDPFRPMCRRSRTRVARTDARPRRVPSRARPHTGSTAPRAPAVTCEASAASTAWQRACGSVQPRTCPSRLLCARARHRPPRGAPTQSRRHGWTCRYTAVVVPCAAGAACSGPGARDRGDPAHVRRLLTVPREGCHFALLINADAAGCGKPRAHWLLSFGMQPISGARRTDRLRNARRGTGSSAVRGCRATRPLDSALPAVCTRGDVWRAEESPTSAVPGPDPPLLVDLADARTRRFRAAPRDSATATSGGLRTT